MTMSRAEVGRTLLLCTPGWILLRSCSPGVYFLPGLPLSGPLTSVIRTNTCYTSPQCCPLRGPGMKADALNSSRDSTSQQLV